MTGVGYSKRLFKNAGLTYYKVDECQDGRTNIRPYLNIVLTTA
jgi:hypothetical protein